MLKIIFCFFSLTLMGCSLITVNYGTNCKQGQTIEEHLEEGEPTHE